MKDYDNNQYGSYGKKPNSIVQLVKLTFKIQLLLQGNSRILYIQIKLVDLLNLIHMVVLIKGFRRYSIHMISKKIT